MPSIGEHQERRLEGQSQQPGSGHSGQQTGGAGPQRRKLAFFREYIVGL